jgi:hypothetical protein
VVDREKEREHEETNLEFFFKVAHYLLVAHAVGLVSALTLLKDYSPTGTLKGIGVFVELFGFGLLTAASSYATAIAFRIFALPVVGVESSSRGLATAWLIFFAIFAGISYVILNVAILVAIFKFGGL